MAHVLQILATASCPFTLSGASTSCNGRTCDGRYCANGTAYGSPMYAGASGAALFRWEGTWRIGKPGVYAAASALCSSAAPPMTGWTVPSLVVQGATSPACAPQPHKNCSCPACAADWGGGSCPDLHTAAPDLVRPNMTEGPAGPGRRVRAVAHGFAHTKAYHAVYLPTDWHPGRKFPLIVEYMGNGPWTDGHGDYSSGRPEDSNLGYGMSGGAGFVWISMPFLSSDMGADTQISTFWWGCPGDSAKEPCPGSFNATPTISYAKRTVAHAIENFGVDRDNVILTGWSRGAIATGAIGLADDEIAGLWKAFAPYSHVDGDCGWVDANETAVRERFGRLRGRRQLFLGECNVATAGARAWVQQLGVGGTGNFSYSTTSWANHNDAWVLRPSKGRDRLRAWLRDVVTS